MTRLFMQLIKPAKIEHNSLFAGTNQPSISLRKYLQRLSKGGNFSSACFILSLIYIDRLLVKNK